MRWIPRITKGGATFGGFHPDAEYEGRYLLIEWLRWAVDITVGARDRRFDDAGDQA